MTHPSFHPDSHRYLMCLCRTLNGLKTRITRYVLSLFICLAVIFHPHGAHAWHKSGHWLVAYMTWELLDESDRRAELIEILKHHPHRDLFLRANCPDDVDSDEWMFVQAANWPDWVARPVGKNITAEDAEEIVRTYSHLNWHFVNLPIAYDKSLTDVDREKQFASLLAPSADDTVAPRHALDALRVSLSELQDEKTTAQQKAIALSWILHLVGDIHQPMHAATLIASREHFPPDGLLLPKGDQGGNLVGVQLGTGNSSVISLHRLWDGHVPGELPYPQSRALALAWSREKSGDRSSDIADKHVNDPKEWILESHRLACEHAYRDVGNALVLAPLLVSPDDRGSKLPKPPILSDAYVENLKAVSERRLKLAARRLAALLGHPK